MCEHTVSESSRGYTKEGFINPIFPWGYYGMTWNGTCEQCSCCIMFRSRNILNFDVYTNLCNVCWRLCPLPSTSVSELHTLHTYYSLWDHYTDSFVVLLRFCFCPVMKLVAVLTYSVVTLTIILEIFSLNVYATAAEFSVFHWICFFI